MVSTDATTVSFGDFRSFDRSSVISTSSPALAFRTRSIPHTGQDPGRSEMTVGCIGHVYVSSPWVVSSLLHASAKRMSNMNRLFLKFFFIGDNHVVILLQLFKVFHLRHVERFPSVNDNG